MRGYLITADRQFLAPYYDGQRAEQAAAEEIRRLVGGRAELMADPGLDFGVKPTLPAGWGVLAGLRLHILHDLFHVSPGLSPCSFDYF